MSFVSSKGQNGQSTKLTNNFERIANSLFCPNSLSSFAGKSWRRMDEPMDDLLTVRSLYALCLKNYKIRKNSPCFWISRH